ncbi:MAG: hypothetical protein HXX08_11320 [Chloroflexi bacterium]|uniref:Uncharacterized protein n=1 Tax=Candidatus Chlorohelix allophototropha TaxID=3003348 RepID=A0A8T7M285_9CHLR|nr:hypothetical protein [Chloroflexota bacterium]WJW65827.1 hypothetical protein OZ401_001606 [Chloroflexota bacterium L227-S17]
MAEKIETRTEKEATKQREELLAQGYTLFRRKAHHGACDWCQANEGIYPLSNDQMWFSHPNCICRFTGYEVQMSDTETHFGLSQEERDKIPDSDFAGPDRTFPIDSQEHLESAARLIGHAANPDAVKRKAIRIAKRKGYKLPDAWQSKMSDDEDDAEMGESDNEEDNAEMGVGETASNEYYKNHAGSPGVSKQFSIGFASATEIPDTEIVVRRGKVFEAGDYPEKEFSITPEEMEEAVKAFKPVPIDYQHVEGPLDGEFGKLAKVRVDPKDPKNLLGEVAIPKWLHALFKGKPMKVSTTWDIATKKIIGLAMVNHPAVSDAAVLSAFSQAVFANRRHNKDDQATIQHIHDATAKMGASCGEKAGMAASRISKADMSLVQGIHDTSAKLGAECSSNKESKMSNDTQTTQPDVAEFTQKMAEMAKEVEELKRANQQLRDKTRYDEAVKFAENEITANRAYPAEKSMMVALYVQAAKDDEGDAKPAGLAQFGETKQQVNRVTALKAMFAVRPSHTYLTQEVIRDIKVDGDGQVLFNKESQQADTPSADRIAKLVGYASVANGK